MIELVHDQRQIHALHAGVVPPRLSQAVGAEVAPHPDFTANGSDHLPGLAPPDRCREVIGFGVEEDEEVRILINSRIRSQVFLKRFLDTIINNHFVAFAPLLFMDPKALPDLLMLIDEVTNPQRQQVRDAKGGIDPHHEQQ